MADTARIPLKGTITHVVGARPNFPKAAPVLAALAGRVGTQRLVHTGQHYDDRLSESFFRDLQLPQPDINLGVGSGSHAQQTADLLVALEDEFLEHRPDLVVVYGDINSTVAAALCATKLGIPIAHVEAGLRSFDRTMPEEVNRVLTDQLAALLFTTSPEAAEHLAHEGVASHRVHFVGNPMIDTLLAHVDSFDSGAVQQALDLPARYVVATIHRPSNVDDPTTAGQLVAVLHEAAGLVDIVIPLHPRGRAILTERGLDTVPAIHVTDPLGYRDFMSIVKDARAVITDSGGVQEETTILGVPCLTLRPNTERPITITHGTNTLVDITTVIAELRRCLAAQEIELDRTRHAGIIPPLWDGHAGERIADVIEDWIRRL